MHDGLITFFCLAVLLTWIARLMIYRQQLDRECYRLRTRLAEVEHALHHADGERVRFRRMMVNLGLRYGRRIEDHQGIDLFLRVSSESEVEELLSRATSGASGTGYLQVLHGKTEHGE